MKPFLIQWFVDAVAEVNKRATDLRELGVEITLLITEEGELSANIKRPE